MPKYTYNCEHCHITIEISKPMARAGDPEICECSRQMIRDYVADNFIFVGEPRTLGSLADKNAKTFSEVEKQTLKDSLDHRNKNYEINN